MSTALVLHGGEFTRDQIDLIKRTIATGATDDELALFVQAAQRLRLDPFARQVFAVKRWSRDAGREVMSIQVSIDGFRLVAERTGKYAGQLGPFWTSDGKEWTEVWLSSTPPAAAKVAVLRHDFKEPVWAVATWEQYKQEGKNGLSPMWKKMGPLMLAKCAESLALRRAFPNELSGVYSPEEMAQATTVEVVSESPANDDLERLRATVNQEPPRRNPGEVIDGPAKKLTAADIPHEGVPLSDGQLKKIHILRKECGGVFTGEDDNPDSFWRVKVLRVYRNQKGERLTSSTQLSKNQASHLIDRLEAHKAKVTARANEPVGVSPITGEDPVARLVEAIAATGDEEQLTEEICDTLRIMQVGDISTPERASAAFALIAAWKTPAYEREKARIIGRLDP